MFELCGRTLEHGYTISSPCEPEGSGELKSLKIFSYRTNSPMIMKLGMEHYVLKLYTVYINDDPD